MSDSTSSRRDFFKTTTLGLGASALSGSSELLARNERAFGGEVVDRPGGYDFTKASSALQPDREVRSACQFCNSLCGLWVHLKAGRVIEIRGEYEDPVQAGELCVKAEMMGELLTSPHRLKAPMKRVGGEKGSKDSVFEAISWEEALDMMARKFLALRDAGEARAIANKTSGRLPRGVGSVVGRFFELIGSPNNTDVGAGLQ